MMNEEKFDAMKELNSIRDSLSKAVEQGMKNLRTGIYPAVDVYETENSVVIRTAPIAGLDAASVEIAMENGVLTISGNAAADTDIPENVTYITRERRFGPFARDIRIAQAVKAEAAQAKLSKSGALIITIPKAHESQARIINVTPAE